MLPNIWAKLAWLYFVQKCDLSFLLFFRWLGDMGHDMKIFNVRDLLIKSSQLMEMRRKETERSSFCSNVPDC